MLSHLRPLLVILLGLTVLTGIAYPWAITGIAQAVFRDKANGSLIERDGKVIGSKLIAQNFSDPKYFWPRPSAAVDSSDKEKKPYNAMYSSGSNYGPTSKDLKERIEGDVKKLKETGTGPVPTNLATASGSGLDPHISPEAALFQAARVAKARNLPEDRVRQLVQENTEGRDLGFLGEPRVNVLLLNLALDKLGAR